jgi:hypothetical protein
VAGDHPKLSKLRSQISRAFQGAASRTICSNGLNAQIDRTPPSPWRGPDPEAIEEVVSRGKGLTDLWEASPIRIEPREAGESVALEIIAVLFPANPLLCCGKNNEIFATRRREVWSDAFGRLALIVPNPMLSTLGRTDNGKGHWSEHAKVATAARVYLAIEFDFAKADKHGLPTKWAPLISKWEAQGITILDACAALLLHLAHRLPLVVATYSGSKSLLGWFYVLDCDEERLCSSFMNRAVSLGADPHTWGRSQFVRIPDGMRNNGRRQRCFYFDPQKAVKI